MKITSLKKGTTQQDVANLLAYLASEHADGITTGQNITVDGSLTYSRGQEYVFNKKYGMVTFHDLFNK